MTGSTSSPLWLRLLGGAVLAILATAMLYAVGTVLTRFGAIGV